VVVTIPVHGCAQVVKVRGEAMAAAAAQGKPHGMLSVIGVTDDDLTAICADAKAKLGGDTVCQIANFLFPQVSCLLLQKQQRTNEEDCGALNHCLPAATTLCVYVSASIGAYLLKHRSCAAAANVRLSARLRAGIAGHWGVSTQNLLTS